jgi:hypothetical protein
MQEIVKLAIGILALFLGIPIGEILASRTKEELRKGREWFRIIVIIGLIGGFSGLIIGNDIILFSFFFIAIVTSRSLSKTK